MKRQLFRWAAFLQIGLVLFTGCHPTQPFFVGEDGDLSHYLQSATQIEYPDLNTQPLPEASQSMAPFTVDNSEFEFLDLSLEECIDYALVNAKVLLSVPGSSQFDGDIISTILSSQSQQLRTVYDPALISSTTNSQPLVVDQSGSRILPRGAVRGNQVGGVEDALSEFDAQYSSFLSYNTTDRQRNSNAAGASPAIFEARDTTYQSAISKRIATGGAVTARSQTIYSANNVALGALRVVPSDYTQILEAQVQHPLMRNRGTLVNRIPVVLARLNEDQSLTQFEEGVRNLVKKVEFAYWDLYCAYWAVESAKIGWLSSLEVYRASEARNVTGVGETAPAFRAKAQAQRFHAQLKASYGGSTLPGNDPGVLGREAELRFLMGWGATDGRLIRPSDRPTVAKTMFDWEAIRAETLGRNLDIRNQKTNVKRSELELISSKNQLLPDLNLTGAYRWTGMGDAWLSQNGGNEFPGDGTRPFTSAWESLLGGNYQEAAIRVEFTPNAFGMRRALADVTNKELALAREHATLEQKEVAAIAALSREIRNLYGNYAQLQIKLHEWTFFEQEAKLRMVKFAEGAPGTEGLLEELLRAQQSRAQAQQEYYRAVCEYNKSIVMVHLQKGSLLDYNNVALTEGPWAEKAYWDAHERARERDAALFLNYGASRPSVVSQGPVPQRALGDQIDGFPIENGSMMMDGESYMDPIQPMEIPSAEGSRGTRPEFIPTPSPETNGAGKSSSAIRSRLQSVGQNRSDSTGSISDRVTQATALVEEPAVSTSSQWTARSNQGRSSQNQVGTGVGSTPASENNSLRNAAEWSTQRGSLPANGLRNP